MPSVHIDYRLAAFSRLSPERRSGIFREQLAQFRTSRHMTAEQQSVVDLAVTLFSPEFYSAQGNFSEDQQQHLDELGAAVRRSFTSDEARLFRLIGGKTRAYRNWEGFRVSAILLVQDLVLLC
jgi:hypothetical protein